MAPALSWVGAYLQVLDPYEPLGLATGASQLIAKKPMKSEPARSLAWIWTRQPEGSRNAFLRFRRELELQEGERVTLRITAESRYIVWVNGQRVGHGPIRAWPGDWYYDEYELGQYVQSGRNVVAVLVSHFGEGFYQYLPAAPGLAAEVAISAGQRDGTQQEEIRYVRADCTWRVCHDQMHLSAVPRMCMQMGFEERVDARFEDHWMDVGFDDQNWLPAVAVNSPHGPVRLRPMPLLASEVVRATRVLNPEVVRSIKYAWTINLRPYVCPREQSANPVVYKGFLVVRIESPCAQEVEFMRPHWYHQGPMLLNGIEIPRLPPGFAQGLTTQTGSLFAGANTLIVPMPDRHGMESESSHGFGLFLQFTIGVETRTPVRWCCPPEWDGVERDKEAVWAFVGPFALTDGEYSKVASRLHNEVLVPGDLVATSATEIACERLWKGVLAAKNGLAASVPAEWWRPICSGDYWEDDVAMLAMSDAVTGEASILNGPAIGSKDGWTEFPVPPTGGAVRLLVDFGTMVVGDLEFEVEAERGAVIDFHCFEFIQRDGRMNYSVDMNNTLRFVCGGGRQRYRSIVRRGYRYVWVIVRHSIGCVRMRDFVSHFIAYPQAKVGKFTSSDPLLNRIWEVGAHTLRCCAEDAYTDCPTYEQVLWVGDARNEALVDWMMNGDPRLWNRCLHLAAGSLSRSPLVESHVPSSLRGILPAWSFLWMRSLREYLLFTGDREGARRLFPALRRNVSGIAKHLNGKDLFEIRAWNMFDWAEMDTPDDGVVTHNNCFAVLALEEVAELALWLEEDVAAAEFRQLAARLRVAINRWLWDPIAEAYVDCIHKDGRPSRVFSQQTQTVAYRAQIPPSERMQRVRQLVFEPPTGFIKAGSPFFQFFILEVLEREACASEMLETIRRQWGFMIEEGADTFWEMWSLRSGRLTRSHCHGWSAAPTFFLSHFVLGVSPVLPGYEEVEVNPQLGNLESAEGLVPTPHGIISIKAWREGGETRYDISLPPGVRIRKNKSLLLVQ